MDYRKLIKFGDSSFVVSLPKPWLKKNQLEKGNLVYVSENGNNELIIAPQLRKKEKEIKSVSINVDGKNIKRIKRELISAYLKDYNIVILEGKDIQVKAEEIRGLIQNLMALEVIEQTKDKIITKDFLNLRDIPLKDLVRKMDIITRSMMMDLISCLHQESESLSLNIVNREKDVSSMSYVILRVVRNALSDPEYIENLKINQLDLFEVWNIASQIELVADHVNEVALSFPKFLDLSEKEKVLIENILKATEVLFVETMKAYHMQDLDLANKISITKNRLVKRCKEELASSRKHSRSYHLILDRIIFLIKEINKVARRVYS